MKTLKALLQKYKDIVLYVVFGGLTTLVNIVSFYVLEQLLARGYGARHLRGLGALGALCLCDQPPLGF